MQTEYWLMARFQSPTVPLKDISEEFFGITPKTAEQQAKAGQLPVPTFKLRDSERSPTLVHLNQLAEHIDQQLKESKKVWLAVNTHVVS